MQKTATKTVFYVNNLIFISRFFFNYRNNTRITRYCHLAMMLFRLTGKMADIQEVGGDIQTFTRLGNDHLYFQHPILSLAHIHFGSAVILTPS